MRMSQMFVHTLRDVPSEAGPAGYQLLLRGGFMRPLNVGSYSFLPLGVHVQRKLEAILIEVMHTLNGQEVALPLIQPLDLWLESGRWSQAAQHTASFRDSTQRSVVLATSHQEAVLLTARNIVQSYRQLPVLLYQIWRSFRNEGQTWGGLFGAREMMLMDGYSLHADWEDLDDFCSRVLGAFSDVFDRCELDVISVVADQDDKGAVTARKLVWRSEAGREVVACCHACGYAADQDIARAGKISPPPEPMRPMQDVETPHCETIADLAQFLGIPESGTAKALFLVAYIEGEGDRFIFAIVRGDTHLSEAKLKRILKAERIGPATEAEIRSIGAEPGYGSPLGLKGVTVVVDDLIPQSLNLVAGANRPGFHTLNVNYGRDYQASIISDIILVQEGDSCPDCGAALRLERGVTMAHLVKEADAYSQALNAFYLDRAGKAQPLAIGHYCFYVDRTLAAVAEAHHDDQGLVWPWAIAPYAVYLMTLGKRSPAVDAVAERLYADLAAAGLDVLYDDRDERAGVKFNDADLLGMPLRVAVGERGLERDSVEVKLRLGGQVEAIHIDSLVAHVKGLMPGAPAK